MTDEYAIRAESGYGSLNGDVLCTYSTLPEARKDLTDYFPGRDDLAGVELAIYRMERVEEWDVS